jgi:hypothetical protein
MKRLLIGIFASALLCMQAHAQIVFPMFYSGPSSSGGGGSCTITTTSPLPAGTVGVSYSQTINVSGGCTVPITCSITAGALPSGLSLGGTGNCTVQGTPTTAQTTTPTIQAADSASHTPTQAYSITINTSGGGGETPFYNCPPGTGFSSSGACSGVIGYSGQYQISGTALYLGYNGSSGHAASNWWSTTQTSINSNFDATFWFYQNGNMTGAGGTSGAVASPSNPAIAAMSFIVQNNTVASSNTPSCPTGSINIVGQGSSADANMASYGAYGPGVAGQCPIGNSIAIKFDWGGVNGTFGGGRLYPSSSTAMAQTGLYYNWGPWDALVPSQDMAGSYGLNLYSQHVFKAHVWYDNSASLLSMTVTDTVTGAQYRTSWSINIPTVIGGNSAWFGFGAGQGPNVVSNIAITGVTYNTGLYTRLAAPTLSLASGAYSSSQTETITCPSGATCYYTTNGQAPTTNSTQYTAPFTVSSSEIVQAVAIESGYTDSYVASGNYLIQSSGPYPINIATFTTGNMQPNGSAVITGGYARLTDTGAAGNQAGTVFYPYQVATGTFTAHFTIKTLPGGGANSGYADCSAFVMEGTPTPTSANNGYVSSGPNMVAYPAEGCGVMGGYPLTPAVVVNFDEYTGQIGVYQNGSGSAVSVTGISLTNTTPIAYTLVSNGSTIALSATQSGVGTFSHTYTVNVPSVVGSSAYVGFGAGNGGGQAEHDVTEFDYTSP